LAPVPLKTTPLLATRLGFEEFAESVKLATAVSVSPMVRETALVVFSGVDWSAIVLSVGAVFGAEGTVSLGT
jgi:hypothetical protein